MRCKIGTYRKYLCIGWLCLLISGISQMGHAALKIYYVRVGDAFWENTLWRMDINGENKEPFLEPPIPMQSPRVSPDGQQILFTTRHKLGEPFKYKLMVMNFDGRKLRKLRAGRQRQIIYGGEWSPDGKRIAYIVADLDRHPFKAELFVMNARGLNSFQIAPGLKDDIGGFNWFPDSKRLALSITKPLEHGKLHWIDTAPDAKPDAMDFQFFVNSIHWSPNGERAIVTGSIRARGRQELFLGDALGKNLIRLDAAGELNRVQWMSDNKHIVYAPIVWNRADDVVMVDVAIMNVDTQAVRRLTDDGQSQLAFWHNPTLAVEAERKLSTSWGAIKGQFTDAEK